ncbi:glycosyltransferase family 4 protein [Psychrobacter sp. AOP7-B1-24]|uniref:glycosyltransferase family 4 protein n=1 Tax=Psychrobacter sp. AOP7-B1-24 TaxID=3457645 RepID=UPI00402B8149
MRFLIIASHPPSLLNFRGELIAAINQAGFDIDIAAPEFKSYPKERRQLETLGYTVHDIPMQRTGTNPIADSQTMFALYRLMKQIKPDYVMGYTIKPVIYGLLAAKLAGVPHRYALITGLGYAFQGADESTYHRTNLQKLMHKLYAMSLRSAHKVFFQNPDDEALFKSMKILQPATPTKVVNGSGVDVSEYKVMPFPNDNAAVPAPSFLLIARLLGAKGVREYAKAAEVIKLKYPQAQFNLVGWIDDNPDAIHQHELDSWIDDGRFEFWGKLSDVKPAIAASSVYVLPSYREGTPRTVLEAMAMGRPIITTDAPGCRETVRNGYNGYLVPVKAVDELAAAMERFILNPELIISMGASSRQLVEEKFDVNSVNKVMLQEMGL